MADPTPQTPDPIDPSMVEGALVDAFPGVSLTKSSAVGRRRVFIAEFAEFKLSVTTPETPGMRKPTTLTFRRTIEFKQKGNANPRTMQVFNLNKSFPFDDAAGLLEEIRRARSYCLGIVYALSQAFNDPYSDDGI